MYSDKQRRSSQSKSKSLSEMMNLNDSQIHIADVQTPLINEENGLNEDDIEIPERHVIKNKLGTINGCYVPCLLNIMGIVLFERLGWGIGQVGMSGVFFIFLVAEFNAILTVLSLSAIVTNGSMRGGGSYYMISRTLGPEFGGSIGMLFYAAYCVGVAFYCTGFAEEIVDTWGPSDNRWVRVGVASIILFICLIVALMGAGWFTKINVFLFIVQFAAIIVAMLASFFRSEFVLRDRNDKETDFGEYYIHYNWSFDRFKENWETNCNKEYGDYLTCYGLQGTFGVLFPAATGIMEGANLSGDLANPAKSIPRGTLAAVITSMIVYTLLIWGFAGSYTAGILIDDTTIMQEESWGDTGYYLVIFGILISASSSALGSLFGGSRVLQAVARDKLFPGLDFLGYGSTKGDEPRVAVLVTWAIAQCITLIGSINAIAPISTAFFCLSYATVNLACFFLEVSGTPNFRPQFRIYSWHTCLIGLISNLIVMFYVDYKFGTGALICEIIVFVFLAWRAPKNVWGDVTQSVIFHQVRKYLLRLDERKMHSKLWRPSILLFVDTKDLALIDFCNNLKKGGLYVCGTVLNGEFDQFAELTLEIRREWLEFIERNQIKAFPQIAVAPTARIGYENLLLLSGLGAMQPNTVVLPLLRYNIKAAQEGDGKQKPNRRMSIFNAIPDNMRKMVVDSPANLEPSDYLQLLKNILKVNKNVIVTYNFEHLDYELVVSEAIKSKKQQTGRGSKLTKSNIDSLDEKDENMMSEDMSDERKDDSMQQPSQTSTGAAAAKGDEVKLANTNLQLSMNASMQSTSTQGTGYWTFGRSGSRPAIANQWVDVWLFTNDYSFDLETNSMDSGFPMLLMQLAHILLLNKVWDRAAGLRVMLVVPNSWTTEDQNHFDSMIKELRLDIDDVVVFKEPNIQLPSWTEIMSGVKKRGDMKKYFKALNQSMTSISSQTYFSFMKLPEYPPSVDDTKLRDTLVSLYFECLYVLLSGMPPSAMVVTGEEIPVISVDI